MPMVDAIRSTGATTLEAIMQALNQRGIRSARGGKWHVSSVSNLLAQKFAAKHNRRVLFYRREIVYPAILGDSPDDRHRWDVQPEAL
jgi:hypothetical protein